MAAYNLGPYRPRPRGEFSIVQTYRYLDIVSYNGESFMLINEETIEDGITGINPINGDSSELYWLKLVSRGEKGETANQYYSFKEITDGVWDFTETDKIIVPSGTNTEIKILNIYSGCCGLILSEEELTLPENSDRSIDFYYITRSTDQYYLYTFVYGSITGDDRFIWNRSVITK